MNGPQLLFLLKYLLIAIGMLGSAHALGQLVGLRFNKSAPLARSFKLTPFIPADPLLRFFFHTSLGLAAWSYLVFFLGISNLLYRAPIWAIFIGSIVLELALLYRAVPNATAGATTNEPPSASTGPTDGNANFDIYKRICWADSLFVVIFLSYSFCLFLHAIEPPHVWDDLSYHLPFAKLYANSHALVVGQLLRFPVMNQFAELLFTAAYMLFDIQSAQIVSWNSGILTLIGMYAFLRQKFGPYTGVIGCVVLCSSKLFSELFCTAYVETTMLLYITGFVIALLKASTESQNRRTMLILASICAGCAFATKYTALVIVVIALGVWLFAELISRTVKLRDLIYVCTPAIIVSSPWLIRNFLCSGNPVFPFFSSAFGLGVLWNNDDLRFQWAMWKSRCIVPVTLNNIIQLPWILSFECHKFRDHTFARLCHYSFLASLLGLFIKRDRVLIALFVVVQTFLMWWFYTCQNPRYALPVLPVVAIFGAWATHIVWEKIEHSCNAKLATLIAALGLTFVVALGLTKGFIRFNHRPMLVLASTVDQEKFLRDKLPTYAAYEFLNLQKQGNLYGLWDDRMNLYYTNGTFVGSDFGPGRWHDLLRSSHSKSALLAHLGKFHIKYLLVNKSALDYWHHVPEYSKLTDRKRMEGLSVIFEDRNAIVYRIP